MMVETSRIQRLFFLLIEDDVNDDFDRHNIFLNIGLHLFYVWRKLMYTTIYIDFAKTENFLFYTSSFNPWNSLSIEIVNSTLKQNKLYFNKVLLNYYNNNNKSKNII